MKSANPRWSLLVIALLFGAALGGAGSLALWGGQHSKPVAAKHLDARFPGAKTAAELALFKASEASCKLIDQKGLQVKYGDGTHRDYLRLKDPSGSIAYVMGQFDENGKLESANLMPNMPPEPCWPKSLNEQIVRAPKSGAAQFLIDYLGRGYYTLHMHQGSSELSNLGININRGLVTNFESTGPSVMGGSLVLAKLLSYSVPESERMTIQAAVYPNN